MFDSLRRSFWLIRIWWFLQGEIDLRTLPLLLPRMWFPVRPAFVFLFRAFALPDCISLLLAVQSSTLSLAFGICSFSFVFLTFSAWCESTQQFPVTTLFTYNPTSLMTRKNPNGVFQHRFKTMVKALKHIKIYIIQFDSQAMQWDSKFDPPKWTYLCYLEANDPKGKTCVQLLLILRKTTPNFSCQPWPLALYQFYLSCSFSWTFQPFATYVSFCLSSFLFASPAGTACTGSATRAALANCALGLLPTFTSDVSLLSSSTCSSFPLWVAAFWSWLSLEITKPKHKMVTAVGWPNMSVSPVSFCFPSPLSTPESRMLHQLPSRHSNGRRLSHAQTIGNSLYQFAPMVLQMRKDSSPLRNSMFHCMFHCLARQASFPPLLGPCP